MIAADVVSLAGDLPGVTVNDHHNWSALTVAGKGFCWVSHTDDVAMVKSSYEEQSVRTSSDPATYSQGRTTGSSAWLIVELCGVDADEFGELLAEGWRMNAPATAVAAYDAAHGLA